MYAVARSIIRAQLDQLTQEDLEDLNRDRTDVTLRQLAKLARLDRGDYFYKPTPTGQRLQQQLDGYGNAKVIEIEDALNEAAQQRLIGVDTRLVSVDAPPWLHLNAVRTSVIVPEPTFAPLD